MTSPQLRAHVTGWGSYAPSQVLTNADLERLVDTSDEWIVTRTGIRERRVAAAHETTASMAAVAGARAIAVAGLRPDDSDVILLAPLSPDYWMPSTAALVKEAIGNTRAPAMDVAAACSGFVYAYSTANAYVPSGMARHVLVIGAELLTRFLDYSDRGTCILFGDGAGAVVVSAGEPSGGALGIELTTEPQGAYMIWLPAGGAKSPPSAETVSRGEHYIRMEGKETYRFATRTLASTALAAVRRGDTLVVPKLDRLARSVPDARAIGDSLAAGGVRLSIGGTVYDPSDPMGKMFFNILATFAEFEVDLLRMRTREGMAVARANGRLKGKAPKLSARQRAHVLALARTGEHTIAELAELVSVSRATIYREIARARRDAS